MRTTGLRFRDCSKNYTSSFGQWWKDDSITGLQTRNKWYKIHENLKVGDMVLFRDENSPPAKWPLGRITAVKYSKDGLVQSATVCVPAKKKENGIFITSTTTMDRPVQKLCLLLAEGASPPPDDDVEP